MSLFSKWLSGFKPPHLHFPRRDQWIAPAGVLIAIFLTDQIGQLILGSTQPWLIAPMAASAALLFATPASPLAQPWSLIGGNVIGATIGVFCYKTIGHPALSASVAVALSMGLMMRCRCLHPPSAAVAMTAVIGSDAIHQLGYQYIVMPTLLNSMSLVVLAIALHALAGKNYPHQATPSAIPKTQDWVAIDKSDIEFALKNNPDLLDVEEEDIEAIFMSAENHAKQRIHRN